MNLKIGHEALSPGLLFVPVPHADAPVGIVSITKVEVGWNPLDGVSIRRYCERTWQELLSLGQHLQYLVV